MLKIIVLLVVIWMTYWSMPICADADLILPIMSTWPMARKDGARTLLLLFTLVHIHIYSKSRFSIKTIPSNPLSCLMGQKKRKFWLSPVNCGGFPLLHLEAVPISFTSFPRLAWDLSCLKSVDLGLIPFRIVFSVHGSLCWVLMWVPPQSLVLSNFVGAGIRVEMLEKFLRNPLVYRWRCDGHNYT